MIEDSIVPNIPSASLRSALLAAARSLAALTAHRAVIHYRSLGCGFALPTPYTGEAFTRELFDMHYLLNSKIHPSTTNLKLIMLPYCTYLIAQRLNNPIQQRDPRGAPEASGIIHGGP